MFYRLCLSVAALICLPLSVAAQSIPTGPSLFTVNLNGKSCGKISSSITPSSSGYTLKTTAKLQLGQTSFAFSRSGTVDRQLHPVEEIVNGTLNGSAVLFGLQATTSQYNIKISANGQEYSNTLATHPHTVFLPDFDAAALQMLVTDMSANQDVWAVIPKQKGILASVQVVKHSQVQGTLSGKPIPVQHLTVTISGLSSEIFTATNGLLLQQETPEQGFALIRDGFQLTQATATSKGTGTAAQPK